VFFCYFGIPLQKQLVQTLTLILKQITRITNRAQPDYVRNGAYKKNRKRNEDRCPHKLIWLAHWCVFLSLRGVWLRILLTFFLDRGNHLLVYGPDKALFLSSACWHLHPSPPTRDVQYCATLTYHVLIPWNRVLIEKLIGYHLVKKFPVFYGNRKFITAFTSARHLSLYWATSIQSVPSHPTSWRSIVILSSLLRRGLPSDLFPSGFPTKTLYTPLLSSHIVRRYGSK